jgi:hypothetical protein
MIRPKTYLVCRLMGFALALGSTVGTEAESHDSAVPPVVQFSFYAPVQEDSPVQIVGLENNQSEVQLVLLNATDKWVVGIMVAHLDMAPPGCSEPSEPRALDTGERGNSNAFYKVRIAPRGKVVESRADVRNPAGQWLQILPHYPRMAVLAAHWSGATYIQAQLGVTGVYFEDGSTWPAAISMKSHNDPFDPELVEAESGKCPVAASLTIAVKSIEEVVFGQQVPIPSHRDQKAGDPPHLRFSCSLEGVRAVCRLPLDTNQGPQRPRPETPEQKQGFHSAPQ